MNLLKGSSAAHFGSYLAFAISVVTLIINLGLIDVEAGANATAADSPCAADPQLISSEKFYAATAFTFATGQVIPLAKATRDRFVASLDGSAHSNSRRTLTAFSSLLLADLPPLLPTVDGAPKGLKALGGTPESYYTTLIFFVISILLCFQAISDVAGTADEWSSMLLSLFFLVCASSWLCKQVRDRADVNNEMWEKDEKMTKVILFLARGTGTNVILCVTAFVSSILLTLVIVWKSVRAA